MDDARDTRGRARRWTTIAGLVLALSALQPSAASAEPATAAARAVAPATRSSDDGTLRPPALAEPVDAASSSRAPGAEHDPDATAPKASAGLEWFPMAMSALAGLVLFIFGVTQLAQGLGDLNSERMRRMTARFTSNRVAGVATGFVATTLLESSSVTIIMVIAMVSSGVLGFVSSLGVVLGANIGTAVGAQIIALNTERYVPLLMLGGLLLMLIGKSEVRRKLGIILLGFGLMFYGLEAIDEAVKPLRTHEAFMHAMQTMGDTPWLGALLGAIFTMIIQSSSATVAIIITLAGSGLINLEAGVAMMLGAEIGTCSDTLVATIGRGRQALRTGVFHLAFNLTTAFVGVALAGPFVALVESISGAAGVGRKIANAQMLFNGAGVALALPFLPMIARALERLIPDASASPERAPDALVAE